MFYVSFEKSTCVSMRCKTAKGSTAIFGLFEEYGPKKAQVGCGQALSSIVWSWKNSLK